MLDTIRYLLICGGALILGFNIAVYKNAERITGSPTAWRIYIVGDSLLTVYVIASLSERMGTNNEFSWRIPVAALAIVLTIVGLFALNESYKRMQLNAARAKQLMERREHELGHRKAR
jgi:hypothetical protein